MILQRLVGFVPVDMNPRQLIPAVRAHGLQLGVFLQRHDGLVEALQPDQDQPQAVPGPVKLGTQLGGSAKRGLGPVVFAELFEQEAVVEPVPAVFRFDLHQLPRTFAAPRAVDRAGPAGAPCWPARSRRRGTPPASSRTASRAPRWRPRTPAAPWRATSSPGSAAARITCTAPPRSARRCSILVMVATSQTKNSSRKATSGTWRSRTTLGRDEAGPGNEGPGHHLKQLIEQVLIALGAGKQPRARLAPPRPAARSRPGA